MSTDNSRAPTDESKPPKQENDRSKFPRTIVDPDGDLCLVVGDKKGSAFVVCSKTVARASPVWKKLLYGEFAESLQPSKDSGEEWTVRLPDDNPGSMKVLLNIIHSRFDQVPIKVDMSNICTIDGEQITFSDLFLLTVLTDKYDLTRNLRPWATTWLEDVRAATTHNLKFSMTSMDHLCWIAWELGDEGSFTTAIKHIVLDFVKIEDKIRKDPYFPELFSLGYEPAYTLSKLFFSSGQCRICL